jgi:hypothetical protein
VSTKSRQDPRLRQPISAESIGVHEAYVFSANGRAAASNEFGYPSGEKHALLILLRQRPGSEADWIAAEITATVRGWYELVFSETSTVPPENLTGLRERALEAYRRAMENGSALVAFADPIE